MIGVGGHWCTCDRSLPCRILNFSNRNKGVPTIINNLKQETNQNKYLLTVRNRSRGRISFANPKFGMQHKFHPAATSSTSRIPSHRLRPCPLSAPWPVTVRQLTEKVELCRTLPIRPRLAPPSHHTVLCGPGVVGLPCGGVPPGGANLHLTLTILPHVHALGVHVVDPHPAVFRVQCTEMLRLGPSDRQVGADGLTTGPGVGVGFAAFLPAETASCAEDEVGRAEAGLRAGDWKQNKAGLWGRCL